jgi:anti-sigma regulatory factor (Ser/Thr protein kinase)/CheY-like chemotaxis protein
MAEVRAWLARLLGYRQHSPIDRLDGLCQGVCNRRKAELHWAIGMGSPVSEQAIPVLAVGPAEELDLLLPGEVPCEVDRAGSAVEAIIRLARKPYRLVLIDHTAEGDLTEEQLGYLRALQAIRPGSKTIVLVSHTTSRKVIEALRHGIAAYFARPFDPLLVRDAIAQALSIPNWSDGIELLSATPDFISVRLRCRTHTADRLAQFMNELPCTLTDEDRAGLSTAFREMLLNAIEHGGKLDPNEWVHVSRVRTRRTIIYHIHDPGEGFSQSDLRHAAISNPPGQPTAHIEIRAAENMRPGGFGMLITSQSVDEVIYNEKGNEVTLVKYLD